MVVAGFIALISGRTMKAADMIAASIKLAALLNRFYVRMSENPVLARGLRAIFSVVSISKCYRELASVVWNNASV